MPKLDYSVSYLDLPDLDNLSLISPVLFKLSSDPVLHRNRLRIVAPCRIEHSLFAQGCHGTLLRPTIADLVHWNIMRGLGIERRWRAGNYFLSAQVSSLVEARLPSIVRYWYILLSPIDRSTAWLLLGYTDSPVVRQDIRILTSFGARNSHSRSQQSSNCKIQTSQNSAGPNG